MITWLLLAAALWLVPQPLPRGFGDTGLDRIRHHLRKDADGDAGIAWVLALAGELRAGTDSLQALRTCSRRYGIATHAARAAVVGADVAQALRRDATDTPVLRPVAAAWGIAQQTGSGLADVLENIADGHRRTIEVRRDLAVELAGPRATSRLMSLLPLVGVGFAIMLGADPIGWFTSSWSGLVCLVSGLALNAAGFGWINRIVHRVEADL